MARIEKNAAGEDVPVDTAEFGCIVIEAAAPTPQTKAKAAASKPEAATEGDSE
jgi:hypothetical protein